MLLKKNVVGVVKKELMKRKLTLFLSFLKHRFRKWPCPDMHHVSSFRASARKNVQFSISKKLLGALSSD
jgi:hypothetical protein